MRHTILSPIAYALLSSAALLTNPGPARALSPNERIHVLQKRDYSVKNKLELSLFGGLSIGDVFTEQFAAGLAVDYHLDEAFAFELMWLSSKIPFVNGDEVIQGDVKGYKGDRLRWGNSYTGAYDEVKEDASLKPSNADLSMLSNYLGLNVEFSPLYGKWTLFNSTLGHADFYLTVGGGVASTEFKNGDLWQDTGTYFVGNFGLGFRIFLTRWFAIRLDCRDYTFAARVEDQDGPATKIRNTVFVTLGLSFLFLGEEPVEIWSPY